MFSRTLQAWLCSSLRAELQKSLKSLPCNAWLRGRGVDASFPSPSRYQRASCTALSCDVYSLDSRLQGLIRILERSPRSAKEVANRGENSHPKGYGCRKLGGLRSGGSWLLSSWIAREGLRVCLHVLELRMGCCRKRAANSFQFENFPDGSLKMCVALLDIASNHLRQLMAAVTVMSSDLDVRPLQAFSRIHRPVEMQS